MHTHTYVFYLANLLLGALRIWYECAFRFQLNFDFVYNLFCFVAITRTQTSKSFLFPVLYIGAYS